jgi:hypothetical protein
MSPDGAIITQKSRAIFNWMVYTILFSVNSFFYYNPLGTIVNIASNILDWVYADNRTWSIRDAWTRLNPVFPLKF